MKKKKKKSCSSLLCVYAATIWGQSDAVTMDTSSVWKQYGGNSVYSSLKQDVLFCTS